MAIAAKSVGKSRPPRRYRPTLEVLEDRHIPSAGFGVVNLASNVPGLASTMDPNLINPWGIAFSPTGPFWLADNGDGVSDVVDGRGAPFALVVSVPAGSAPTGVVFNSGPGFAVSENGIAAPGRFLFATESGTIAGWTTVVDPTRALLAVDNSASGAVYTGLALAADDTGASFLYAADFSHGTIDVFDQDFRPVVRPGAFQDPTLPAGFTPFNIQGIGNLLYVTYAQRDSDGRDDVPGAGHGFIDVYSTDGSLLRRFASQGALDSPWGLAVAPNDFGPFGGALLVGNNGDGHISAYDPASGALLGQLTGDNGMPIGIPYLWALTFGNGHVGGDSQTLFFAAGVADSAHGLFGAIQAPARRGADTAGTGAFDMHAPGEPGDYPLPPRAGPTLQAGSDVRPTPTVDLLPAAPSSLVLVPTLSMVSSSAAPLDAPVAVAAGSTTTLPVSADSYGAALSALLDLNAVQVSRPMASVRSPDAGRRAIAVRAQPSADRDGAAESRASQVDLAVLMIAACPEQGPDALLASGVVDHATGALAPASQAALTHDQTAGDEHVKAAAGEDWAGQLSLLFLVGSPLIWIYRASRATWFRRSSNAATTHSGDSWQRDSWKSAATSKARTPTSSPLKSWLPWRPWLAWMRIARP
jgi:uncharacterized protein (TIGR03118 family)